MRFQACKVKFDLFIKKKENKKEETPNPTKKCIPLRKNRPAGLTKAVPLLISICEIVVLVWY